MRGFLLISDGAAVHGDNTISLMRAGIGRISGPGLPLRFNGKLVLFLFIDEEDSPGPHNAEVYSRGPKDSGERLLSQVQFEIKNRPSQATVPLALQAEYIVEGDYVYALRVDDIPIHRTTMKVVVATEKE